MCHLPDQALLRIPSPRTCSSPSLFYMELLFYMDSLGGHPPPVHTESLTGMEQSRAGSCWQQVGVGSRYRSSSRFCLLTFHITDKTSLGEKVYIGSQSRRAQSMAAWPHLDGQEAGQKEHRKTIEQDTDLNIHPGATSFPTSNNAIVMTLRPHV